MGSCQTFKCFRNSQTPETVSIFDFTFIVLNMDIGGFSCLACNDHSIKSGSLNNASHAASDISKSKLFGVEKRRFPADEPPVTGRRRGAGQRSGHNDNGTVRMKGVCFGVDFIPVDLSEKPAAPDKLFSQICC